MQTRLIATPYWWDSAPPADAVPAEWQNRADVVIIGGGFTGFGAAIPLARAGLKVVIVEKDKIGAGVINPQWRHHEWQFALFLQPIIQEIWARKSRKILSGKRMPPGKI